MLTAKKITKQDLPLLKRAAQSIAQERGKGTVRESMRRISVKGNTTYGIFMDGQIVGWKVTDPSGRVVTEMGITSLEDGGLPVFSDENGVSADSLSSLGFTSAAVVQDASLTSLPASLEQQDSFVDNLPVSKPFSGSVTTQRDFTGVISPSAGDISDGFSSDREADAEDFSYDSEKDAIESVGADLLAHAEKVAKARERYGLSGKQAQQYARDPFATSADDDVTGNSTGTYVPASTPSQKKPKMTPGKVVLGIVLTILVLAGGIFSAYSAYKQLTEAPAQSSQESQLPELDWNLYTQADPGSLVHVQVISGMTPFEICETLAENGLVSCAREFMQQVEAQDAYSALTAGEYIIPTDEDAASLVARMVSGKRVPDGVIGVNNGDTLTTIVTTIDKANLPYNGGEFLLSASDVNKWKQMFSMLSEAPENLPTIEGYIASDEYDLSHTSTPDEAVEKMLAPIQQQFEQSGMTSRQFHDMLTKASLIEKEALFDEDRPLISSVIDNRLAAGAPLQIDAAVKYANNYDEARVYDSHLEVDSPYNTYKYVGLPVGPICSGIAKVDIDAAMNPTQTDFFYYVLKDTEGHHQFCVTPEEFEVAKQQYLTLFGYEE